MEFIETIEVSNRLRVRLHTSGNILLEIGTGPIDCTRAMVRDTEALVRALNEAELISAERRAANAREARASEPIDQPTRKAIFAALRETYEQELTDDARLEVVSKLAGRPIWSMSGRGNMTMADAHRVLDALSTLRDFRA